jgi:hypothetical protein
LLRKDQNFGAMFRHWKTIQQHNEHHEGQSRPCILYSHCTLEYMPVTGCWQLIGYSHCPLVPLLGCNAWDFSAFLLHRFITQLR